jgi:hypothetical protein
MDARLLQAKKEGEIDRLLAKLPVVQEARSQNQVLHTMVEFLAYRYFGFSSTDGDWANGSPTTWGFSGLYLTSTSSEPSYDEYTGAVRTYVSSLTAFSVSYTIAWKRFVEDAVEPYKLWTDANGVREGLYYRDRFLWLPSQGVINNIRGVRCILRENADGSTGEYLSHSYAARVRFKDSGGSPVTLAKTGDQAFLVEYLLKLFSR